MWNDIENDPEKDRRYCKIPGCNELKMLKRRICRKHLNEIQRKSIGWKSLRIKCNQCDSKNVEVWKEDEEFEYYYCKSCKTKFIIEKKIIGEK